MAKVILIGVILLLTIFIVIGIILTLIYRRDFIECENNESPFCPQFSCPSAPGAPGGSDPNHGPGIPAVRRNAAGTLSKSS
jgi:hypothetical protein